MMMSSSPAISNGLFLLLDSQREESRIKDQRPTLMIQFYMQIAQALCFVVFNTMRAKTNCTYFISFSLLLIMMVIIPLLSIGLWIWTTTKRITWLSGYNNGIDSWLFCFPCQGIVFIYFFIILFRDLMKPVWEMYKEEKKA